MGTLKIENASYIFTLDPLRRIIRNGSILIDGQNIQRVGTAAELTEVTADRVIDARDKLVSPGFINGHDHLYPQVMRGMFLDELTASYVEDSCAVRNAMQDEEEYVGTLACVTEHLKHGTTTILNPGDSQRLDAAFQAYSETRARIVMGSNVTDAENSVFAKTLPTNKALAELERILKVYGGRCSGRVTAWVMLAYATLDCTEELAKAAKRLADSYGTGMTFHQSARQRHVDACLKTHGVRPIEYLERIGVVGPNVVLGHAIRLDQAEVDILARTQTRVVTCPGTAMRLGYGLTVTGKLPEMHEKGVVVGLGTDTSDFGVADTMRAMYLIAGLYKDCRESTKMIPAETAFEMATLQGAKALGMDKQIGSLEPGKKADIVLLDARRLEWQPLLNPVNNLVYNADGRSVHTVIVDGDIRIENGKPTFVDEWELGQRVHAAGERLLGRTGYKVPSRWPIVGESQ